jgi:hypothetical protein
MASEFYQREDLSIYVVAGVPRSFKSTLAGIVKEAAGESGDLKLVDGEMTEWLLAKLRENGRRSHERTPASAALWRAFRALSAARYHLHDEAMEEEVREIRERIEELWNRASPLRPA